MLSEFSPFFSCFNKHSQHYISKSIETRKIYLEKLYSVNTSIMNISEGLGTTNPTNLNRNNSFIYMTH